MKKLIVNADDFGYSTAVNAGIITSHKKGIVTSATLMANMPGTLEAIELVKKVPTLGIGAHLVLSMGRPVTKQMKSIVNKKGEFPRLNGYDEFRKQVSDEDIFAEWCGQVDFLLSKGVKLTHFDSHHHIHARKENWPIVEKISKKYKLSFRNCETSPEAVGTSWDYKNDVCINIMEVPSVQLKQPYKTIQKACLAEIKEIFENASSYDVVEAMVHPGFLDEYLYFNSSFNIQRMREVEILTDPQLRQLLESMNVELCNYGNL